MITKSMILGLLLTPLSIVAVNDSGGDELNNKLDEIEVLIAETEMQTATCQMHSTWRFPVELYGYLNLARKYAENVKKTKNQRKVQENLQSLLATVDECIKGKEGYWAGNWNDVWVDPVPSVPDCALQEFLELREELTTMLPPTSDDILVLNQ
ncbi:hypothetical protein [Maribellus mangrovi]|uniref:hypothetical protein n=1 Tax=Maribellus mangrovi TaxID=3133146 RepID=UPI0030ED284E